MSAGVLEVLRVCGMPGYTCQCWQWRCKTHVAVPGTKCRALLPDSSSAKLECRNV